MPLSQRQKEIVRFIEEFTRRHGYPPSIREIGRAVGISSTSVVNYNLNILQREGFIRRDREVSRGIRLVEAAASDYLVSIPLLGRIAAGQPLPVPDENPSLDTIELTRNLVREEEGIYALEVRGDSMIDALINDGDIVVMKYQNQADNGDMVAVWLKDREETTLKKIYQEGDRVRLQPANPLMKPIFVHPSKVEIQGKVIMVIRRLNGS